jgi:hypothetical protein
MNTIKLALNWWKDLSNREKAKLTYYFETFRSWEELFEVEIETIFYNEVILKWYVGKYGKIEFDYNEEEIKNIYLKEHSKEEPMKNIFLIPTDKPSRLRLDDGELVLGNSKLCQNTLNYQYQNIYITSDEEIKEGDYMYDIDGDVGKAIGSDMKEFEGNKKIILTTDQYLIKDGVQPIDDEFLEWFVKNPSCEEVEIADLWKDGNPSTHDMYQIIIPQEEPKDVVLGYKTSLDAQMLDKVEPKQERFNYCQSEIEDGGKCTIQCDHCKEYYAPLELEQETLTYTEAVKKEERIFNINMLNKETLEEAAFRLFPRLINDPYNPKEDDNKEYRDIWISGAKWKQETLEDIKLEVVLESSHCQFSVIENKLAILYRNQEKLLKAIKLNKK